MSAARYHSLVVERASLDKALQVTAWTADGTVMAVAHRDWPVVGLQFHPESILTSLGYELLAAFLRIAGIDVPHSPPTIADEQIDRGPPRHELPTAPVTF